eukprot:GGOE01005252.1.p1 GENE.GGOE01005252.1~~GGOE01005252.1.p1  ORF type:complete len:683 (-),score=114.02 GGOE01005252.1:946-2967(-)
MAPRESNVSSNCPGPTTFSGSTSQPQPAPPGQQLFHSNMLPFWLATMLAHEGACLAILCGAPCSGKTEAARRMVTLFGDLLAVVSNDMFCDAQRGTMQNGQALKAHQPKEFETVVRCLAEKPRALVYDDGNTHFQEYADKLTIALAAGVKVHNIAWFVFDRGMEEFEEVEHLMNIQRKRLKDFWQGSEYGTVPHASDGKIASLETVWRAVRQIRGQYFNNLDLKVYNAEWIVKELLEYAQSQHTTSTPLPPHASNTTLIPQPHSASSLLACFANPLRDLRDPPPTVPILATSMTNLNTHSNSMLPTNMAPLPATLAALTATFGKHGTLPANTLAATNGGLGGIATYSNSMPIIGLPADQNSALSGDQQYWDQQHSPMHFVLTGGDNGSQMMPLQLQMNLPSSAASPPFTVTNPVTSSGEQTTALDFDFDESSFARALCLAHCPGQSPCQHTDFSLFPLDESPQPSSPLSPSPAFHDGEQGKKLGAFLEPKARYFNAINNPFHSDRPANGNDAGVSGCANGHGNGSVNGNANGNGHSHGSGNGHSNNVTGNGSNGANGGSRSSKHGKSQKSSNSDSLKGKRGNGKKKLQNNSPTTPLSGGLTLQSVLNDYWKIHKVEFDANNDFNFKVPEGLLSKSAASTLPTDMALNGKKVPSEDSEENVPLSPQDAGRSVEP